MLKQFVFLLWIMLLSDGRCTENTNQFEKISWSLGPCHLELMEDCHSKHIRFYLYAKQDENPAQLQLTDSSPPKNFNRKAKTKVLIHGYAGNLDFNGTQLVKDAYLQRGQYNIIVVDWGNLVRLPCYLAAVLNTRQAGKCIGKMLTHLRQINTHGYRISKLHLIGFSLGAHVAALASNYLRKQTNTKIARITGLDPALPCFASFKKGHKLDRRDARFVDIIHTNSGIFGKIEPTGHADFYVNGGLLQPECRNAYNPSLCSHLMATIYYTQTILIGDLAGQQFKVSACQNFIDLIMNRCRLENKIHMGEKCSLQTRGIYHVATI